MSTPATQMSVPSTQSNLSSSETSRVIKTKRQRTEKAVSKPTVTKPTIKTLPDSVLQTVVAAFFDHTSMINTAKTCRQFRVITQQTCLSVNHRGNREYLAAKITRIIDLPHHVDGCFQLIINGYSNKYAFTPKAVDALTQVIFSDSTKVTFITNSLGDLKLKLAKKEVTSEKMLSFVDFFKKHAHMYSKVVIATYTCIEDDQKAKDSLISMTKALISCSESQFKETVSLNPLKEYESDIKFSDSLADTPENREFLAHQYVKENDPRSKMVEAILSQCGSISSEVRKKEIREWLKRTLIIFEYSLCEELAKYPFDFLKDLIKFEAIRRRTAVTILKTSDFIGQVVRRNLSKIDDIRIKNAELHHVSVADDVYLVNAYGDQPIDP